jgi:hypothetical protein
MMTLRDYKLSLVYFVEHMLLPSYGYVTEVSGETLTSVSSTVYGFANENISYIDASGIANPSGVTIYDDGNQLDVDQYVVNYLTNQVTLDVAPSGTITSDYSYRQIKILDAFPDEEEFENLDLPFMSIDFSEQTTKPFAIGVDSSWWLMHYFIHVFAVNDGMRLDVMDCVQRFLRTHSVPIIGFTEMPLTYDGILNEDFDFTGQLFEYLNIRSEPRGQLLNFGDVSPKERFRALISGTLSCIH